MNKKSCSFLTVIVLLFTVLACEDHTLEEPSLTFKDQKVHATMVDDPIQRFRVEYRALIANTYDSTAQSFDGYIGAYGSDNYFNYERHLRDVTTNLKTSINVQSLSPATYAKDAIPEIYSTALSGTPQALTLTIASNKLPSQVPGATTIFNSQQLSILDTYANGMYSVTAFLGTTSSAATKHYNTAVAAVQASSLNTESKIEMFGILEAGNEFARAYFARKYNGVYSDIAPLANASPKPPATPCVNWRTAWWSGIAGGIIGGTTGFKLGSAGGTVAFPGLGSATGALGGTIIGFATGFATGVITSVAVDVVANCLTRVEIYPPVYSFEQCSSGIINCCNCSNDSAIEARDFKKWYQLRTPCSIC